MGKVLTYCTIMALWVLLLFSVSCSVKRTISALNEETATHAKINGNFDELRQTHETTYSWQELTGHLAVVRTIEWRVYDTEKDVDSVGKHPLLAEGVITEDLRNEVSVSEVDSVKTEGEEKTSAELNFENDERSTKDEYDYAKRRPPAYWTLVVMLGVIALVFFAIKIYNR